MHWAFISHFRIKLAYGYDIFHFCQGLDRVTKSNYFPVFTSRKLNPHSMHISIGQSSCSRHVCTTTSNMQFTLKVAGRNREFPLLFVLLISRPLIIISCSAIGESYPDGGGSCSFEESRCGWSTGNYGWMLTLNRASDNYILLRTEYLRSFFSAKLESPELCSTRDSLYSLAFQYSIKNPNDVKFSVHISVLNEEILLGESKTERQRDISKSNELIDFNCTLCRHNSFTIFFTGTKLCEYCNYGEIYLYSVSLHYKGSVQTTSTYVTHSTTVLTDLATEKSTTLLPNGTTMGMNGNHGAQCGNEGRLPPGAEAAIAIIIMLLIIVIVSIIIIHQRQKKKTGHGVRWRFNRNKGEAIEAVSKNEKMSVDNSAHTNDDNQSAKRRTNPGKMYGFKPQNADVELASAPSSDDYYVINEDVDRQRTNGNMSKPSVFHANSHSDFVPDNDYNKLHADPTNNRASPDVYNHLQSSCLQGTSDKEGVYSFADSDVIECYVNHEYITANAVLNNADEYKRVKASSSKTRDDTYNHLTKEVAC